MVEYTPDKRNAGRSIRPRPIKKMPQFDVSSFFNQIFWLSLFFSTFYLLTVKFVLPDVVSSVKARVKKEKSEVSLASTEGIVYNRVVPIIISSPRVSKLAAFRGFKSAY